MLITLGVEDDLSESVAVRLLHEYAPGFTVAEVIGGNGKDPLRQQLHAFRNIAIHQWPVLVLTDQDSPQSCPPALLRQWTQSRPLPSNLLLRVAVLEVEAWLLADRSAIAQWLSISANRVPYDPENILNPKQTVVHLASRSRHRRLREAIAPDRVIGTDRTGPDYNLVMAEFVDNHWNPEAARQYAPSLNRAIIRIAELIEKLAV